MRFDIDHSLNLGSPAAVRQACMELAAKGIRITHWESGHPDTIEVTVCRNIGTAMAQTSEKMNLARDRSREQVYGENGAVGGTGTA